MIHATPPITTPLQRRLDELDELHASLAHEIGRSAPWDGSLRRDARVDAVVSSTSIEGYTVDLADANAIIDGANPASGDPPDRWAVACYARAMDHIRVMAGDPLFQWLDRVVLDLHFDACLFQRDRSPGRYRTTPIHVTAPPGGTPYAAPDADLVTDLMQEAIEWMERGDRDCHVVVRAAMAHLHVVSIHPFRDGNGRISRLVQSLMLARDGILAPEFASIERFLADHTQDYYRQLQLAQGPTYDPARDATSWVTFCVDAHVAQARAFQQRTAAIAARWNSLEALADSRGWPDRIVTAMEQALVGELSRSSYVAELEIPVPTASTDLRRLADAGLIDQVGKGRSTAYVASAELRRVVHGAR